jgi:hypothetical protein
LVQIVSCLRVLSVLFFNDDEDVLVNVCAAFALVLPGAAQQSLCDRLLALLRFFFLLSAFDLTSCFRHSSMLVRRAALCTVMEIVKFDDQQVMVGCTPIGWEAHPRKLLRDVGLLSYLADILKVNDNKLRTDACEVLILLSIKGERETLLGELKTCRTC